MSEATNIIQSRGLITCVYSWRPGSYVTSPFPSTLLTKTYDSRSDSLGLITSNTCLFAGSKPRLNTSTRHVYLFSCRTLGDFSKTLKLFDNYKGGRVCRQQCLLSIYKESVRIRVCINAVAGGRRGRIDEFYRKRTNHRPHMINIRSSYKCMKS